MKNHILFLTLVILFIGLVSRAIQACTVFCLDNGDQHLVGYNHDWFVEDFLVIVNKRCVSKKAFPLHPRSKKGSGLDLSVMTCYWGCHGPAAKN